MKTIRFRSLTVLRSPGVFISGVVLFLILHIAVAPGAAFGQARRVTDEEIQASIEQGVQALLDAQLDNGWWSTTGQYSPFSHNYAGGQEVCAMLALAYAGVPMSNEKMQKGFDALMEFDMLQTYNSAFRVLVIAKLYARLDRDRQPKAWRVAQRDIDFLISLQHNNGGWGYPAYEKDSDPPKRVPKSKDTWWDFSNTQMAILALSEAKTLRIEIPPMVWKKAQDLFIDQQLADGGWNYGHLFGRDNNRDKSYGSMTAAAVASLMLTRDNLYPGLGCPCVGDQSRGRVAALDNALEKGFGWLGTHFAVNNHPNVGGEQGLARWIPYWLYSCERVGLAGGIKYFGGHDWYAEGAEWFLRKQDRRTGMWGTIDDTSYAICFLVKGRAPILFNKLQFKGLWNSHPQDMANLVDYIGRQKEQLMQWQVITLEAPVEEWHDAPILYITAESALDFSAEDKAKLRQFTETGGTIFYESSCGNRQATMSWRNLIAEVWPEYELRLLDSDHPLFSSDRRMTRRPPGMLGMDDGLRTFMFVTFTDISCIWAGRVVGPQQAMFDVGMNMYTYATDRRPLRARLASVLPDARYQAQVQPGDRPEISVVRLKHGGDWAVGSNYRTLNLLAERLAEKGQLRLNVGQPAAPSELAEDAMLAYLTGRRGLLMLKSEAGALKAFIDRGGMLLVEAAQGSPQFDVQFREAAKSIGLTLREINKDHPLLTGRMDGTLGYEITSVGFKFNLRRERLGHPEPQLFLLTSGDRVVGVYSPFDLMYAQTGYDAFDNRGYDTDDARAILTNILLMVSSAKAPAADAADAPAAETPAE